VSHCRTVALQCEQATRASSDRHSDSARMLVQASTCVVGTIPQMGHGLWPGPGSRLRCDLYPELLLYIQVYCISLKASNCHAMPCHAMPCYARLGSACDTISLSFCFSLDLPVQYRPAGFGLGAQFGGRPRLHQPVQCSRLTSHNHQSGIQGASQLAAIRPKPEALLPPGGDDEGRRDEGMKE
jgi:hypothetical protein